MHKFLKENRQYILAASALLVLWGIVTLDWFKVIFGLAIVGIDFAFYYKNQNTRISENKAINQVRSILDFIGTVQSSIESAGIKLDSPKAQLAQCLYFIGIVDSACRAMKSSDDEFILYVDKILRTFDYGTEYIDKVYVFHQKQRIDLPAYKVILEGGQIFVDFIRGNKLIVLTAGKTLRELIDDPLFPATINEL